VFQYVIEEFELTANATNWLRLLHVRNFEIELMNDLTCPQSIPGNVPVTVQQFFENSTVLPEENLFCDRNIVIDQLTWTKTAVYGYFSLQNHEEFCR